MKELALYDTASRALDKLDRVDEVKAIRDEAVAVQVYARQAKDTTLIRKATNVRLRAERRAGELLAKMEKNKGGGERGVGRRGKNAVAANDRIPTLADLGISKTQSSHWQQIAALDADGFKALEEDTHAKQERGHRNAQREVEIEQERAIYRARTEEGCTIDDLESLIGKIKFGVIVPDFPWPFKATVDKGKQRSAERHYDTMSLAEIMAMAPLIRQLAADDCVLLAVGSLA